MITRILLLTFLVLSTYPAQAADFQSWLTDFKADAARQGISQATIDGALTNLTPIPRVVELDRKQPEGRLTFAQYRTNVVNKARITKGRALYKEHQAILTEVSKKYGVQPQYIVSLWGIETNFGGYTGGFSITQALATLAHDGRRSDFFRKELINALKIQDEGHITNDNMKGSWAGAMGQSQFMPSSFLNFAVDHDQDGKKDIWGTKADVFASAANYLSRSGWKGDERWGRAVLLPAGLDSSLIDSKSTKPLTFWVNQGIKSMRGAPLPPIADMQASLIQPDGPGTQAFLTYSNFRTTLKWNRSTYFAASVGLLADAIAAQ